MTQLTCSDTDSQPSTRARAVLTNARSQAGGQRLDPERLRFPRGLAYNAHSLVQPTHTSISASHPPQIAAPNPRPQVQVDRWLHPIPRLVGKAVGGQPLSSAPISPLCSLDHPARCLHNASSMSVNGSSIAAPAQTPTAAIAPAVLLVISSDASMSSGWPRRACQSSGHCRCIQENLS